ncbi:MAG: helix-turn-helix transcriptional regulator [Halochromatium sp.]|uniref:helix-turn-helix transcriptional regulator n=1 Tax=Halochromatium sp. TaxID=2049430 RepID=UPI003979FF6B
MGDESDEDVATRLGATIGAHLRAGRKRRFPGDSQDDFARRIGVSRHTYQKMEAGDPAVALRSYLLAAERLGIGRQFADGMAPPRPAFFDD